MPDVVIVGGGVIGCATAYYLARQGASVTVLERGELGSEASGAAAGMLAALSDEGGDRGPDFQALCLDSLALYDQLLPELAETGIDLRYSTAGVLHLALDEHEVPALRHRFDEQRGLAPENLWLEGDALRKTEPQANPAAAAGLLSPREHYLDPKRLVLALAEGARRAGARIETGTPVIGLHRRQHRIAGVATKTARFEADHTLLAGGPWTAEFAKKLEVQIPVRPVRGQMLSLSGPAQPLNHVIWGEAAYLVPREDGQTFAGATMEEVGFRKVNTTAGLTGLRRGATGLVPSLANAPLRRSWAGLRPATPDGLPILGQLPGYDNVWVATGHFRNGILLSAITGQLMAASILAGETQPRLKPFSPARFVS